jgi:prepilin-type N-terminal cleavage/methylation domain-containing protein
MRVTAHPLATAERRQSKPRAVDGGYSLIEVVIVVVVLVILAAIAFPILRELDNQAKQRAVAAAASAGARQVASQLALGRVIDTSNLESEFISSVTYEDNSESRGLPAKSIDGICVTATNSDAVPITFSAGPGC